ncbi:MAG: Na/Pi symporter, partial [Deltaproteobacteria bacterium]
MTFKMLSGLLGGIGLFLLGMRLMTEGFRFAAGHALHNILARSTATRLRGLLSGTLITSVVQSSGAVTVATIGFVNAGMMHLSQAVSVIYGSNIGTTMTGWLV